MSADGQEPRDGMPNSPIDPATSIGCAYTSGRELTRARLGKWLLRDSAP